MRTKPILHLGLVLALILNLSTLSAQCLRRAIQPKAKQEQAPTDSIKAKTFLPASKALVTGQISYLKSPHFRKLGSRYTSRQIYLAHALSLNKKVYGRESGLLGRAQPRSVLVTSYAIAPCP